MDVPNSAEVLIEQASDPVAGNGISGLRRQLTRYALPDKKIPQDIVSALCMVAYLLYPLYVMAYPEGDDENKEENSDLFAQDGRYNRKSYRRSGYHPR